MKDSYFAFCPFPVNAFCTGSQDNYFRLFGQQNNNNNPKFRGQHI